MKRETLLGRGPRRRAGGEGNPGGPPCLTVLGFVRMGLLSGLSKGREAAQSCPTLFDPMDCSPPGSSIHRIFQARVLEWGAISFSRGSSRPRD